MKKIVLAVVFTSVFVSCKNNDTPSAAAEAAPTTKSAGGKTIAGDGPYKGMEFDNDKDFYCEMDIHKYGVADTLHYKGKLYGFCSQTCKDAFLKEPEKYLAKK